MATAAAILPDAFAKACRAFIDTIEVEQNLKRLINLPQIAVMGDTSSGKSSLLSAIGGIEFPSSADICTRCPTRLHLERSNEVSFEVTISWAESCGSLPHYKRSATAATVTEMMSEAQQHILSQLSNARGVSESIVEVKVSGPTCQDLTLIDLPGSVRTIGKGEDEDLVQRIQDIIHPYLCNPRCIILAVVPANVDFHNSQIMADAAKHDPSTMRIIPVITKPDLVDKGAERSVAELLLGRKTNTKFELGFHMVKLRSQSDVTSNTTLEASLAKEKEYFFGRQANRSCWLSLVEGKQSILGIPALCGKLSQLYMDKIFESVPAIINELQTSADLAHSELKSLEYPEKLSDQRLALYSLVRKAKKCLATGRDADGFTLPARLEELKTSFAESIANSRINRFQENGDDELKKLKETIRKTRTAEPLIFPSTQLFCQVVQEMVELDWRPLFKEYVEDTVKLLMEQVDVVEACVGPANQAATRVRSLFRQLMEASLKRTLNAFEGGSSPLQSVFALECNAYTQNHYLSDTYMKIRNDNFQEKMNSTFASNIGKGARASQNGGSPVITVEQAQYALHASLTSMQTKASLEDSVANDLHAGLSAYGKVAAKRICDNIPSAVQRHIIDDFLACKWADDATDDHIAMTFMQDASTIQRRGELEEQLKGLSAAEAAAEVLHDACGRSYFRKLTDMVHRPPATSRKRAREDTRCTAVVVTKVEDRDCDDE